MKYPIVLAVACFALPATAGDKDAGWKMRVERLLADPTSTFNRSCSPDTGRCVSLLRSGKAHASVLEGKGGVAVMRVLCVLNNTDDRRRCMDWDRDVGFEEVKTRSGWVPAR